MSTQNSTSIQDLPDELKPCDHMVNLVSRRSDGTLVGPAKWYTDFHVMTCPHCRAAVKGLQELRAEVAAQVIQTPKDRPRLKDEEWKAVEEGWDSRPV
jgi:glutaredoxin